MNILCIGDIVGPAGVDFVRGNLWKIRKECSVGLVVANGENADPGNGITAQTARELFSSGVDVITSGNHVWQKSSVYDFLDDCREILRPCNYPEDNPGHGYVIMRVQGLDVLVINVQGLVFMEPIGCPFTAVERILSECAGKYELSIMDIHAEATSEKIALARHFDGKIKIIYGTHTHVPTADEKILPNGSAFITDVGMCGVTDSALGVKVGPVINKLRRKMPQRFELAEGDVTMNSAVFVYNTQKLCVELVKRVNFS